MTPKFQKRLLTVLSLAVLMSAGGILVWGSARHDHVVQTAGASDLDVKSNPTRTSTKLQKRLETANDLTRNQFAMFWDRPLRRPLFDPPPPPPKVIEKKPPAPIRARLLATMIEAENSTALFKLSRGEVVFRKVGEAIGADDMDATIAKIEAGMVLVRRGAEETRLVVEGTSRN